MITTPWGLLPGALSFNAVATNPPAGSSGKRLAISAQPAAQEPRRASRGGGMVGFCAWLVKRRQGEMFPERAGNAL